MIDHRIRDFLRLIRHGSNVNSYKLAWAKAIVEISKEDDTLGEKLILIIEGNNNDIDNTIFDDLDKYEKPKEIYTTPKFKETASGKVHRRKTLEALNLI